MSNQLELAKKADELLPKNWMLMTFDELQSRLKYYNAGRLLIIFSVYPNDRPLKQVILYLLQAMPPIMEDWLEVDKRFSWLPDIHELCQKKIHADNWHEVDFKLLHELYYSTNDPELKQRALNSMQQKLRRLPMPTLG
jgi:hypothetical protein